MFATPPTIGPGTGTGVAIDGTGPIASTFVIIVLASHAFRVFSNASQIASNSSLWNGACGSPSAAIICGFIVVLLTAICADEIDITGIGVFGVGGATGNGQAASAGYQGRPL